MKEFIDKLIKRFEEEPVLSVSMGKDYLISGNAIPKERVVEIVNELAEEYKLFGNSEQVKVSEMPTGWIIDGKGIHKKTNADRIRSMTDEELAEFLDNNVPDCARLCPDFKAGCSWTCQHHQGKDFLLKWLQSEAE